MINLISFIIALGILIFVHELGHFIVAKLFGVGVEKFSLGFGPRVVGIRRGETEYLISAFPLGGYVKMIGETDESELSEEDRRRSFTGKSPLQRMAIVAAGPLFNILFAWLVYVVILSTGTPFDSSKILVVKGMPAERAGIRDNDVISSINGKPVRLWDDVVLAVIESKGKQVDIKVHRDDTDLEFHVVPEVTTEKNLIGETVTSPKIGVKASGEKVVERFGLGRALAMGTLQVLNVTKLIALVLMKIVIGAIPAKGNVGGPISIAVEAGRQAAAGLSSFLLLLAGLSVNLGVLNLLPIPILDGGHIAFNFWEVIFRKPVSAKVREIAQQIGLVLLIGLMALAFYTDIAKYLFGQG
jgi:regulator of sigma E protease